MSTEWILAMISGNILSRGFTSSLVLSTITTITNLALNDQVFHSKLLYVLDGDPNSLNLNIDSTGLSEYLSDSLLKGIFILRLKKNDLLREDLFSQRCRLCSLRLCHGQHRF